MSRGIGSRQALVIESLRSHGKMTATEVARVLSSKTMIPAEVRTEQVADARRVLHTLKQRGLVKTSGRTKKRRGTTWWSLKIPKGDNRSDLPGQMELFSGHPKARRRAD